jgi:GNAT superfamily N-acetyltransferase
VIPCVIEDRKGDYRISNDPALLQVDRIHAFLTKIYWSEGVDVETVARSLRHSLCVGVYAGTIQVALTRIITDYATFAYLTDVYVEPPHQDRGLAAWMVQYTLRHPDLQNLRRFLLASRDAKGLYRRFGFADLKNPDRFMELKPAIAPS